MAGVKGKSGRPRKYRWLDVPKYHEEGWGVMVSNRLGRISLDVKEIPRTKISRGAETPPICLDDVLALREAVRSQVRTLYLHTGPRSQEQAIRLWRALPKREGRLHTRRGHLHTREGRLHAQRGQRLLERLTDITGWYVSKVIQKGHPGRPLDQEKAALLHDCADIIAKVTGERASLHQARDGSSESLAVTLASRLAEAARLALPQQLGQYVPLSPNLRTQIEAAKKLGRLPVRES